MKNYIYYTYKKFKTSIKAWISIEKNAQNHLIQTKRLVKTIYCYEHRSKKKKGKMILKKT